MESYSDYSSYRKSLLSAAFSCETVVRTFLQKIEEQRSLNAFIEVYADEAIAQAKTIDQKISAGESLGRAAGLVIGIKDLICHKGKTIGASSKVFGDFKSLFSNSSLQRLIDEGAIVIGRLNCDEFGMGSTNENSCHGPVLNAKDNSKVSGGSSGGSAVAVQAGLCHLSLGTDTGGSVRQPASFCGVMGLKPSYGKVTRHGLVAYASSFDQLGYFGNSLSDLALALDITSGADGFDATIVEKESTAKPANKTLAYFKQAMELPGLDDNIKEQFLAKVAELKAAGWEIMSVDFPLLEYMVPTYYVLTTAEASSNLARYDGVHYGHRSDEAKNINELYIKSRSEGFGKEVKKRIMLGTFVLSSGFYDAYYRKSQQVRRLIKEKTEAVLESCDAIISPTTPTTAYGLNTVATQDPLTMYLGDVFTVQANLAGIPAVSLPVFEHVNGMPFGLQLMGKAFAEEQLLETSRAILAV